MNITKETSVILKDYISIETRRTITFFIGSVIQPPVMVLGLAANLISIIVYSRLGIRDGISVCFFSLSCLDLICLIFLTANDCFLAGTYLLPKNWTVDSATLTKIIMYYYTLFYDMSLVITTFVAVQRCLCVVLPFKFKSVFTRGRTITIVAVLSLSCMALYLPVLTSQGLAEVKDAASNLTRWVLWTSPDRNVIYAVRGVTQLVVIATCEVTVIVCLFVFASTLRDSVKFRDFNSNAKARHHFESGKLKRENCIKSVLVNTICLKKTGTVSFPVKAEAQNKESVCAKPGKKVKPQKELQVVKATTVVSLSFVLCNLPRLSVYSATLWEPEFNVSRRYENMYLVSSVVRFTVEAINLASNTFVYLRFNKKYRAALSACFKRR